MAVKRDSLFECDYDEVIYTVPPLPNYVREANILNNEVEEIYEKIHAFYGGDEALKEFKEVINWISTTTGNSFIAVIRSMHSFYALTYYPTTFLSDGPKSFMNAACKYFNTSPPKPKKDTEKEDYELLLISLKG